jgi:dUTP pyrophosphatase
MSSFDNSRQTNYSNLRSLMPSDTTYNFAVLKISVNPNNDHLKNMYEQKINSHVSNLFSNEFPDSGFDLFVPENVVFDRTVESKFIDFQVKTEMIYVDINNRTYNNCAFNVHPRSSISKTPLMLANHTGIIDSGYRGSIIGAFRYLSNTTTDTTRYTVEQNTRLVQICHPTLCPIYVILVSENVLSNTERGSGGFGSTGV